MAIHASCFARRIPWTEEPGGLQSMGSQRVKHDCVTNKILEAELFAGCVAVEVRYLVNIKLFSVDMPIIQDVLTFVFVF